MTAKPLVSGIIIFLDEQEFIEEAIRSVFAQSYDTWELLLIDDGSTDRSTQIARDFAARYPERIRYFEHEGHQNRGMSASRNLGIKHARGKYIALLDGDDVWLPEKLERQVALMEATPRAGMLYGKTEYWHSWSGHVDAQARDRVPELGVPHDRLFEPPALLTLLYPLGPGTAPCLCSILARTDLVRRVGGFEETFRGFYEDQAFLSKVYLTAPVLVTEGCWDRYRIHSASCSATVKDAGTYDSYRRQYLEWLAGYLSAQGIQEPRVIAATRDALSVYRNSPGGHVSYSSWLRLLRVADDNTARLVVDPHDPDKVRIEISRAGTHTSHDIQLNHPRLRVDPTTKYEITFSARADRPRRVSCGVAKGHAPWTNLGFYDQIELSPDWQRFQRQFTVDESEDNARIHFDVGESDIPVDLSSLSLVDLSTGAFVAPAIPSTQPGQAAGTVPAEPVVPIGEVDFGSFRRVTPISQDFGCDRGRPVDRYYIENFLERRREDVRGRVLEIGENTYTRRYGGDRVTVSDVLHVTEGEPQATIIADLASADHIPSDSFDCIILTQTLQLIYDVRAAIATIQRILKPSGVLLATFPGISQTHDSEWGDIWCWNFTPVSARRLFQEAFPADHVTIETFGNVLSAISFLHGLAVDELTPAELDHREPGYTVTIAVRAVKPGPGSGEARSRTGALQQVPRGHAAGVDSKSLILMYHRVAEGHADPWGLAVSPGHFAEHLAVLREASRPMHLQQLVAALGNGGGSGRGTIVTFDDGYADNLHGAKPLLEKAGIPATMFLTTGYLGEQREFWWDELERLLLQPGRLPERLRLSIGGAAREWRLGTAIDYTEAEWRRDRVWRAPENPPGPRHTLYVSLWELLQPMAEVERRRVLEELRVWVGVAAGARSTHRILSRSEVLDLAAGGLIEIGAHSVTHPVFSDAATELQREEVRRSKRDLEEILGYPISSWAYPYGAYGPDTVSIVRETGFRCACSTAEGTVGRGADSFQLPRFEVKDWDGQEFARRLNRWFED